MALKQQAVLFRAAHHSDLLEVELARRNIPFVKYGGLKFLEAAHVKDALSLLRVLENPFDEVSWFRVLQLPEGVGPATARRLMDELGVRRIDDDQPSPLLRFLEEPVGVPKAAVSGVQELRAALGDCLVGREPHAAGRAARPHPRVPRAGVRAPLRRGRVAHARPGAAGAARERLRVARTVRLRAHAGPAVVHG